MGISYIDPIAIAGVEGLLVGEEIPDVRQTGNFELLRLLLDHLAMKGRDQGRGIQQQRSVRQHHIALANGAQILPGHPALANGPGRQIQQLVAVLFDLREELSHAQLGPVLAHHGQDMAQDVRLGDGAIDVRDDHLVVVLPAEQIALAARSALVGGGDTELDLVHSLLEV